MKQKIIECEIKKLFYEPDINISRANIAILADSKKYISGNGLYNHIYKKIIIRAGAAPEHHNIARKYYLLNSAYQLSAGWYGFCFYTNNSGSKLVISPYSGISMRMPNSLKSNFEKTIINVFKADFKTISFNNDIY
ncbi:MAG: hypothetical protein ABIH39_00635 [Candidatus Margulisiibacteriota bacterium]